jgi:sodium-coupled monocarboxylate transporter 8/12
VITLTLPGILILVCLALATGFMLFAFYADCDPLTNGDISRQGEILPHFVVTEMGHLTGLPGIFIASLFSAGLR